MLGRSAAEAVQAQSKVSTESSLFINGDAWLRSEVGGLDVLEGLLQSLNDFRMFVVEVIGFSEVLFQVVELGRRIAGLGGRHGFLRPGFSVATISLSFDELPPHRTILPVPPLLRPGLDRLSITDHGYLLAYALNPGYGRDLADWHRRNPDVVVHCYIEGGPAALGAPGHPNFHVHQLGSEAFLKHLAACRAFVGTAGFESTCEAFFLSKPVLTVPVEGQYEQSFNALDAQRVGAARAGTYADLDDEWRFSHVCDVFMARYRLRQRVLEELLQ